MGDSGGPIILGSFVIAIHTAGGCDGGNPETGENSGTKVTHLKLRRALNNHVVPTLSEWGLIVFAVGLLTAMGVVLRTRRFSAA